MPTLTGRPVGGRRALMRSAVLAVVIAVLASLSLATVCPAEVRWTANGVAVCNLSGEQRLPDVAGDGAGGAIITWQDYRSRTNFDIYAQRIDSNGALKWAAGGIPVCTQGGEQEKPKIVPDGAGGVIITWVDNRSGTRDIYAQKVDSGGNVAWGPNGKPVCAAVGEQDFPNIASDGSGGAFIAWNDERSGFTEIYAQKLDTSGNAVWTGDGVNVASNTCETSAGPGIVNDSTGGAIIAWYDRRVAQCDIYGQRIDPTGNLLWTDGGKAICTTGNAWPPNGSGFLPLVPNGSGGAMTAWAVQVSSNRYVYAQNIEAGGAAKWRTNGVAVSTYPGDAENPRLDTDGAGGAIIAWHGTQGQGTTNAFAQRIDSNGAAVWAENGIDTGIGGYYEPWVVSDGAGGVYIAGRNGYGRPCAQYLSSSGKPLWGPDSTIISDAAEAGEMYRGLVMAADGTGGAVVAWSDARSGNTDIYAQGIRQGSGVVEYYFAEGCTRDGFNEWLCVMNPNDKEITVNATYMMFGKEPAQRKYTIAANSRSSINVNQEVGPGQDVSTRLWSDDIFYAERPMYFDYKMDVPGYGWTGGHCATGVSSPRYDWYFAEGTTREGFEEWICIQNPTSTKVSVEVDYISAGAYTQQKKYDINPQSRISVFVNGDVGPNQDVSTHVHCADRIVAERPMYFNYHNKWTGGHNVMGTDSPKDKWYFAEGTTQSGFEEWLAVQNANDADAAITVHFMKADGTSQDNTYRVGANSRWTLDVSEPLGKNVDSSIFLESNLPVVAERPMYFSYKENAPGYGWTGGHDVVGASHPKTNWFFAEGCTLDNFDEYICIGNPGDTKAKVTLRFLLESGSPVERVIEIDPHKRTTIKVADVVGRGHDVSTQVSSDQPVVAERPMYFNYNGWTGGHDVIGF